VGPAPELEMELAPRLNLITGDNGLGKSFLLDVMWWALTRRWPHDLNDKLTSGYPARPTDVTKAATIAFRLQSKVKSIAYESKYVPRDEAWLGRAGRPWNSGLVIYAHADGGFSVWDPARNYWKKKGNIDVQERLPGYVFSANDVWDGLYVEIDGVRTRVCNGLLDDWSAWIREGGRAAEQMAELIKNLSPKGDDLAVGPVTRLSLNNARNIPSIRTAYSGCVPILHASSGIRRIVGLAYMLLWSWNEHCIAAEQLGEERTTQVVMLFDEIESHLHPRWQRSILGSVLHIAESLHHGATVQLVAATHSPLILLSAELAFDHERDAWFDLDLDRRSSNVRLERRELIRRGTVGSWLISEAFDFRSERTPEAEEVLERAAVALSDESFGNEQAAALHAELCSVLGDTDPFWVSWRFVGERKGWLP
jgi:AAA domain, putative AbiEii toxin, Type IV TA system